MICEWFRSWNREEKHGYHWKYFRKLKEQLMSELSNKLNQVNADLRAVIIAERAEINAKLEELLAKIAELEEAETDAEIDAAIEDTKEIVEEIKGIFEPTTPTDV